VIHLDGDTDDRQRPVQRQTDGEIYVLSSEAEEFIAEHGVQAYVADVFARKGKGRPGDSGR
jgi:hypothetical protein